MKKLFTLCTLFLSLSAFSQSAENENFLLTYQPPLLTIQNNALKYL